MSAPTVVTEGNVTVTAMGAMSSEAEIRASAGFEEAKAKPDAKPTAHAQPADKPTKDDQSGTDGLERDPSTGKFVGKAPDATKQPDGKADDKAPKPEGDPRSSIQAKINAEVARRGEAERRAEAAERRALEAEARFAAGSAPQPTAPAGSNAPVQAQPKPPTHAALVQQYQQAADWPKLEDFVGTFDDPYAAMLASQAAYIGQAQFAEREQAYRQQQAQQDVATKAASIGQAGLAEFPDWDEMLVGTTVRLPDAVIAEINDLDDPTLSARVLRHLLTSPDVSVERLAHPIAAAREIARLSVGLSAAPSGPATEPIPTTRAKPLIKPVSASPAAPEAASPDDLPFGPAYIKRMNELEKRQG